MKIFSLLLLLTALAPTHAVDVEIVWGGMGSSVATAQRSDTLKFNWSGLKPVHQVTTQGKSSIQAKRSELKRSEDDNFRRFTSLFITHLPF